MFIYISVCVVIVVFFSSLVYSGVRRCNQKRDVYKYKKTKILKKQKQKKAFIVINIEYSREMVLYLIKSLQYSNKCSS